MLNSLRPSSKRALLLLGATTTIAAACVHKSARDAERGLAGGYDGEIYDTRTPAPNSSRTLEVLSQDAKLMGGNVEFTKGLGPDEVGELWHLTEGSDVYPLTWFYKIKSQFSDLSEETRLNEKLDQKFGVIKEPESIASRHPFPLKWIGLTSSWSSEHPQRTDVRVEKGMTLEDIMRTRQLSDGTSSVAMIGVNCAFCHTNAISMNGQTKLVEGAPNMLNIRGFFQDLFGSTAKTMLTEDLLRDFLNDLNVPGDNTATAKKFVADFKQELGLQLPAWKETIAKGYEYVKPKQFAEKKATKLRETFFQKRAVVEKYLIQLMQITYGMKEVPHELRMRMKWLSVSLGVDPKLKVTPEGYSRTDAFGRIANWVARIDQPISLDATVSVPPMWGIQYRALFHWNGNTNSVVMRNMGQSFGLGAILLHPDAKDETKWHSTSNLHNLHRIEELLYKVHVPQWQDFTTELDLKKVVEGCNTYYMTCVKCHAPMPERVGPAQRLIADRVFPLEKIGTDETYTKNQATPVGDTPFRKALFHFTGQVRDSYYKRFNVSPEEQAEWEKRSLRGHEHFRDTYLGETERTDDTVYMNIPPKPSPGYLARHLGGVWATAPYLHNGAVPTIEDLLKPAKDRPKVFFLGSRDYDTKRLGFKSDMGVLPTTAGLEKRAQELINNSKVKPYKNRVMTKEEGLFFAACEKYPARCFDTSWTGNSNKGHEGPMFGTTLSAEKKAALIEFLKVLRPEVEYSRPFKPVYQWNGQSCSLVM